MLWWLAATALMAAFFSWRLSRAHRKCAVHAQLNADLLKQIATTLELLPVDPHGAVLALARAERLADDAKSRLQSEGLWRSESRS